MCFSYPKNHLCAVASKFSERFEEKLRGFEEEGGAGGGISDDHFDGNHLTDSCIAIFRPHLFVLLFSKGCLKIHGARAIVCVGCRSPGISVWRDTKRLLSLMAGGRLNILNRPNDLLQCVVSNLLPLSVERCFKKRGMVDR